jgi:phage FluMu protein Com
MDCPRCKATGWKAKWQRLGNDLVRCPKCKVVFNEDTHVIVEQTKEAPDVRKEDDHGKGRSGVGGAL